ncbi:MAG: thioredoxin family protein [Nitriliruptorales bacterium]
MDPVVVRLLLVVAVVALAGVAGRWWQRRGREVREGSGRFRPEELDAVGLDGQDAEVRALLLGSPACVPCRRVKEVLSEVAAQREGFRWVSVDAGDHLELTSTHHVLRVPTLFVLARDGRILARTSGVPATRDLVHLVDQESGRSAVA